MPNWRKVVVSGSNAELNRLNVSTSFTSSGIHYPISDGLSGQFIQTDGLGNLTFSGVSTVTENVKNVSGHTLYKGTPVHATGSGTSGNLVGVIPASASIASTMPSTFILAQTLAPDEEGLGIISGLINGVDTSAFQNGQVIYVGTNGGYTNVAPTGSNLIQNLGIVTKVHPTNGGGIVLGAGRANATPNLLNGYVFYGTNNRSVARPLGDIVSGSIFNYTGSFSGDGSNLTNVTVSEVNTVTASFASTASVTIVHNFNTKNVIVSAYDSSDFYFVPETIKLLDNNRVKLTFSNISTGYAVVAKGGHIVSGSLYIAGPQGFQGFQGTNGTIGVNGAQGAQGNQGPTGLQGTAGSNGSTGAQGNQGFQGTIGSQGFQGIAGTNVSQTATISASFSATSSITISHNFNSKNVIVSAYDSSDFYFVPETIKLLDNNRVKLTFSNISTGYAVVAKGGHLVSGSVNITGPQGLQGAQGTNGTIGVNGAQGAQGNQGPTGLQGTAGSNGSTGAQGNQGFQGTIGSQGFQGIAGTNVSQTATISASFSATSSITISHNFNSKNIIVSAYDSSDFYFVPNSVKLVDNNKVKLTFGAPTTGYAVVAKGGHLVSGSVNITGPQGLQGAQGSSAGITSYTNPADNRVLTSVSSTTINAEANLTFDGSTLTVTGTITETSTANVKENVEDIINSLDTIKKLRGVQYNKIGNNNKEIGVIAEEVDEILPQIVTRDIDGNPNSVSYGRLTALLIEAVKELDNKINKLK